MAIGQSFLPAFDEEERKRRAMQQGQGQSGDYSPVQEAIKILSMRIPRFQGSAPAPMGLLTAQGMPGGQNPVVEQVLRQFGINNPAQAMPMPSPGGGFGTPGGGGVPAPPPPPPPSGPGKPNVNYAPPPGQGGTALGYPREDERAPRTPFGGRNRF